MRCKAVFLDRDGTINIDEKGYISNPEDFELYPFAAKAIKLLNKLGYKVFVLTNQSGIARGYYTFDDLEKIHNKMIDEFIKNNAQIDEIFVSPYHKEGIVEPYNIEHEDRKPGVGLFKKALKKYGFDIKNSYVIGDKLSDIKFGKNTGLNSILVRTGHGEKILQEQLFLESKPDFIVDNLLAAVVLLKRLNKQKK